MRSDRRAAALLALCLGALPVLYVPALEAAPAPWYVWRSRVNGAEHCAQTSPGAGWTRVRGPFRDIRCQPAPPPPLERWSALDPGQRPAISPGKPLDDN